MKKFVLCLAAAVLWVAAPSAADTWKGTLSDSMCGAKHSAEKHGGDAKKHEACVTKCINGGGEYVFLANDKVYKISNQTFADLKAHAGHEVNLTGEMKGESITVSKIEMPKKEGAEVDPSSFFLIISPTQAPVTTRRLEVPSARRTRRGHRRRSTTASGFARTSRSEKSAAR